MRVTQTLHRALQHEPDRVVTICGERVRTWAECRDRVARLAGALHGLGLGPGDRVAMLSLNSDRYHEYLLAVPWAGGVVTPVNIRWSPAEIAFSLEDAGAAILLVDDTFSRPCPRSWPARCRTSAPSSTAATATSPRGWCPSRRSSRARAGAGRAPRRRRALRHLLHRRHHGTPKGVVLSHANLLASALGTAASARS